MRRWLFVVGAGDDLSVRNAARLEISAKALEIRCEIDFPTLNFALTVLQKALALTSYKAPGVHPL